MNRSILLKLGEFLTYFSDIEITPENLMDNIIVIKLYFEIVLIFLKNIEFPSNLVLSLLKFEDHIVKINEKYKTFYDKNDESTTTDQWNNFFFFYGKLTEILNKFKKNIKEEGANVRFTQNFELLKIINKISIEKLFQGEENICENKLKKNKIFGTETEKFVILTINSFENSNIKIFG